MIFTGIVRRLGTVRRAGPRLEVETSLRRRRGDSVAVNGCCLTVAGRRGRTLLFDLSAETLRLTNLGRARPGAAVNLEPSLRLGDSVDGHLVSGHVDAAAVLLQRRPLRGGFARLRVSLPPDLRPLVALKGSVAVDGVSLTVTRKGRGWLESVLIPETLKATTLGRRRVGELLNLEADMLARYVRARLP